jgi:hypothetical protein
MSDEKIKEKEEKKKKKKKKKNVLEEFEWVRLHLLLIHILGLETILLYL